MTKKPSAGSPAQRKVKRAATTKAGSQPPKGRPVNAATRQSREGRPVNATKKPDNRGGKRKGVQAPKERPMVYGAEALAALTVSESRLSKLKGRMILGLTVLLTVMVIWNAVLSASRPEPKLLGMTNDGRIQELPLLDAPLESRQLLFDWVRRNIPSLYDFNYANYQSQIGKARDFTEKVTLESFMEDMESSGILRKVKNDFLILRANIVNEPIVTSESMIKGRRMWVVEVPMNLVYDSGDVQDGRRRQINQPILFTAWVVRANVLEYDGGLMLAKYEISERRN